MISEKIISNFSSVHRFSGNFLFQQETVPDHSTEMALLCINFAELVEESDAKDMCYKCVIHDLEESITSDIPRPIKHRNPGIKNLIDEAAFQMLAENSSEDFAKEVFSAKDTDNVNGFLVHIADRIQCFCKMSREVEMYGNRCLKCDLEKFKADLYKLIGEINDYEKICNKSKQQLISYIQNLITKF